MPLHQWDQRVDRQPVGARQIVARYHRHRRARRVDRPRFRFIYGPGDWVMLAAAALFLLVYLLASQLAAFLRIGG